MKVLHRDGKIIGTATDAYEGPEAFVRVEDGFDLSDIASLSVVDGALVRDLLPAISRERDRRLEALASGYTALERETWPIQKAEAAAVLADPEASSPMLTALAEARGVTVTQFAQHVLGIAAAFAAGTGKIMGAATKLRAMDPIPADYTDDKWWG